MARLPQLVLALAAILCATALPPPAAGAAESIETYEHAGHLQGMRWVLWSRHGDKRAALLDTDSGTLRELPVDGWKWPLWFLPVAEGKRKQWLYGLDNTGDQWILGRTDLEGGGNPEILRRFPSQGEGHPAARLWPGPEGTFLMAVQREEGWMVDLVDAVSGTTRRQIGPLPEEPQFVRAWGEDRWLVIDGARFWSWPDGEVLFYTSWGAPRFWVEPPPMLAQGWPEWAVPRPDGGLFFGSWQYIAELEGGEQRVLSGFEEGLRYPADGDLATAAVLYPNVIFHVDDRWFFWEKGGQRLLRLYRDDAGGAWQVHTMYARPVAAPEGVEGGALLDQAVGKAPGQHWLVDYRFALDRMDEIVAADPDPAPLQALVGQQWWHYGAKVLAYNLLTRTGRTPQVWQPPPRPATVEQVLEQFLTMPYVDVAGQAVAGWRLHHGPELAVLRAERERAIPLLLEQRSADAAYALALLGAEEADPWFRELVFDTTEYGWESGCSYPHSEVGRVALEHLHQEPVRDLIKVKPAQRKAWRKATEAADQLEGMDRWCGEGGHARSMLELFEGEDDGR